MPEVTGTSAAVWMTQHRSYWRSIPLRSCRPGGVACCISNICRNLFLRKLSLILSEAKRVYFQWKPQQIISWVHATPTQTFSEVPDNTADSWDELHLQAGESSQLYTASLQMIHGVIPLFALIQLMLHCPFWPVQVQCHLLTQLHYQLFSLIF